MVEVTDGSGIVVLPIGRWLLAAGAGLIRPKVTKRLPRRRKSGYHGCSELIGSDYHLCEFNTIRDLALEHPQSPSRSRRHPRRAVSRRLPDPLSHVPCTIPPLAVVLKAFASRERKTQSRRTGMLLLRGIVNLVRNTGSFATSPD
jgi:hypothetical protein